MRAFRNFQLAIYAAVIALLTVSRAWAGEQDNGIVSRCPILHSEFAEHFRLRLLNEPDGEIAVSTDKGLTWERLGRVLRHAEKVTPKGFTASKWVEPVQVAATAVNAIHITTDYDPEADRAAVFSIIPKGIVPTGSSFYSPSSSIITDIAPGEGIFGGGFAPLVGNRLWVERGGETYLAEKGYVPGRGESLLIVVEGFANQITRLVFENREEGFIWLQFQDGSRRVIGRVLRPVRGVGRFTGTKYAAAGRVRANHPGVIDVSCSPLGSIAGFQIIPEAHSHSPEMGRALTMTQWMIVAPLSPDGHWEGMPPLFYQYIRPDYRPNDLRFPDWRERLLSRFLVEVRRGDGPWSPCHSVELDPDLSKPLPEWANYALMDVTAIRILFPVSGGEGGRPSR
ncbi:MAG: hypothetical protein GTO55_02425 [Armatimonadetes bacterium]|nr:hypothetical protein [Armatimonadota bacterium]NIM23135.1 hypothetical protein [Armatimonadota bacterium]NIM67003.1 hypothetical protein [Armatimonadota bacterium]NIM75537.1 hypothetical protein [Armatimonadota bacterium]NIN05192.1 hypothetical protein [Armatimonadota bacterium]